MECGEPRDGQPIEYEWSGRCCSVPSGIATAATPNETISIANSSAQGMGHPTGEGASGPPSPLIPQAVLEGGEGAGVNAAQQPAAATSLGAIGSDAFSAQRGAGGGQVIMQTDAFAAISDFAHARARRRRRGVADRGRAGRHLFRCASRRRSQLHAKWQFCPFLLRVPSDAADAGIRKPIG